ncbi:MAG: argininosuccinate synthase, partial [Bacteroidota bacterium]
QYFEPVMRNIEKFMEDSQERVTGKVFINLMPYRFEIEGVESDFDMLNAKFGSYGEENKLWTGEDVKGFTNILANSMKIHQSLG